MTVDHPTFVCPVPDEHSEGYPCCPCEHNLGGCCWHCPENEPEIHTAHDCVDRAIFDSAIAALPEAP
jgi:hypothetical protein